MTLRTLIGSCLQQEDLNFLLTNRIPRRMLTIFMGWFSRIENPLVRVPSLWAFRFFADDLRLHEARKTTFTSLHDCFVRELKPEARPVNQDPDVVVSPCDAVLGASGRVTDGMLLQVKGFPYALKDLLPDAELVRAHQGAPYVTLRLQASMYHRFHAPYDCDIEGLTYISGDTWNVNPIALRRVERLYTRNERAVIRTRLRPSGDRMTLVPVAAILVASMRFEFTGAEFHLRYKGPNEIPCRAALSRGQEMGRFEHGSTIIVFAPQGAELVPEAAEGQIIRMGAPLFRLRP